jgi:uncharacterized membrane protein YeaQ/YmgE (transglycosylase-associated protein family)
MTILACIVFVIVAGFPAKAVVPGEGPGGLLGDFIVGIVGALIGSWIFNSFGLLLSVVPLRNEGGFHNALHYSQPFGIGLSLGEQPCTRRTPKRYGSHDR